MGPAKRFAKAMFFAALIALPLAGGCAGEPTARSVAEAFLDAHYVRIDLEASRALCSGIALSKVDKEIELTSEVEISADTMRPRVYYSLHEERSTPDVDRFVYELSIRAPGIEPYIKHTVISVRPQDDGFRVTNYVETDS